MPLIAKLHVSLFMTGKEIKFDGVSLNTCHSIINLMDVSSNTGSWYMGHELHIFCSPHKIMLLVICKSPHINIMKSLNELTLIILLHIPYLGSFPAQ